MKLLHNHPKSFVCLLFLMAMAVALASHGWIRTKKAHATPIPNPTVDLTTVDLVFVIDNSGSMRKNDPKFITPKVVSTFVGQLSPDSQVGMVLFDQKAKLLIPLTLISDPQKRQQVIDSLRNINYRGQHTNTPVGIERALYELKTGGRQEAQKGIIFVTDGIVDTGDPIKDRELTRWLKEDITDQCKQHGIRIFGIALTEAADFSLLQALAARTNGEYFRTFAAAEISGVLDHIRVSMKPQESKPAAESVPAPFPPAPSSPQTQPVEPENVAANPASQTPPQIKDKEEASPVPQTPAQEKNETVVVIEKSTWKISIAVAVSISVLIGALIFYAIYYIRRRQPIIPEISKDIAIPQAFLEDQGQILDAGNTPFLLNKQTIKIGRKKHNDLVIDAPEISGFHATIEFRNMSFYLEDQRSTNGTMLNDERLKANRHARLKDGDRITFAAYPFAFTMKNPFVETVFLNITALEDSKAATIVLNLDDADSKQGLISCIRNHLMQIYGLSAEHEKYVNAYFAHDIVDNIAAAAHENLLKTMADSKQHCTQVIKKESFYLICSLPGAIDKAAQWYETHHQGFTQFLFKWIRSAQYTSAQCEQLCVVTFGQDPATWVSITIVPTHSRPDPVEIMSVEFLNDEEKSSLALDFDQHGRVLS